MEKSLCTLPDGGCLIETFAWAPSAGVVRKALHLERLNRSADAFAISFDPADVERHLEAIQSDDPLRCRLTVSAGGQVDLSTAALPIAASTWNMMVSDVRLNSSDPYLAHKTSQRALYDETRKTLPNGVDEVIFLNERSEVCEGTITNILVRTHSGDWLTPPISCGCLPGVYRQSLLDSGEISEAVLTFSDLENAAEIRLCNSLRGEIKAKLL